MTSITADSISSQKSSKSYYTIENNNQIINTDSNNLSNLELQKPIKIRCLDKNGNPLKNIPINLYNLFSQIGEDSIYISNTSKTLFTNKHGYVKIKPVTTCTGYEIGNPTNIGFQINMKSYIYTGFVSYNINIPTA